MSSPEIETAMVASKSVVSQVMSAMGKKGAKARAKALTSAERVEIATKASKVAATARTAAAKARRKKTKARKKRARKTS